MLEFWRIHPTKTNTILSALSVVFFGLWINFVTTDPTPIGIRAYHFWAIAGIAALVGQLYVFRNAIEKEPKKCIRELLRLGCMLLAKHAGLPNHRGVRGFFHIAEKANPAPSEPRANCLCRIIHYSDGVALDTGPIEIADPENLRWYFNVRAFVENRATVGDIAWDSVPTKREANSRSVADNVKGVLSFPLTGRDNHVLGTVTFDSIFTSRHMRWKNADGGLESDIREIMAVLVEAIRQIYLDDWDD